MILNDIGMILAKNVRSSAYIQSLIKHNFIPSYIIFLNNIEKASKPLSNSSIGFNSNHIKKKYFDVTINSIDIAKKYKIPYLVLDTYDTNSAILIDALKKTSQNYFIYSGPGGQILNEETLSLGKEYLHFHPGNVPAYRGSTTIYYSIIDNDTCHVSAFFLRKIIDAGPIISVKEYDKPKDGKIIDFIYDPFIRSSLLVDVINDYVNNGLKFILKENSNEPEETYFIIHPVLKHISILSCK